MVHERDIIGRPMNGETAAFEQVVIEYQNLIYTVCLRILNNPHDAQNAAQETFLAAYRHLADCQGDSFKPWLCRIAVNKAIDLKRRIVRLPALPLEEEALALPDASDPAADLIHKEDAARIREMVDTLPPRYREVVQAHYLEERSVADIAASHSLPLKTVETQLYRARKLLRKRWNAHEEPS